MERVFYIEKKGVIVEVYEGEETYKICFIMPNRKPEKLETKYKYSEHVEKGKIWTALRCFQQGLLHHLDIITPLIEFEIYLSECE